MKRLLLISGILLFLSGLSAQSTPSKITIEATHPFARFFIDGIEYTGSATFFWTAGTLHTLRIQIDRDGYQYLGGKQSANTRFRFEGWEDPSGNLELSNAANETIIAHPDVHLIQITVTPQHRLRLNFWDAPPAENEPEVSACTEEHTGGPGVVFLNGTCYWRNVSFWREEGELRLEAYPYPGFAFVGWGVNGGDPNKFVQTVAVNGPINLIAFFRPAKHIRFLTDPPGYSVMIDLVPTKTPLFDPCRPEEYAGPSPAPGAPRRCIGEVDWALGSKHMIGAESPQQDAFGTDWVFDSFSNGQENHSVYEVRDLNGTETLVARFVRGARVSFVTQPSGLQLTIDGRTDWLAYNFVVAPGKVFTVSAPADQVDEDGRKWVFQRWSNGGDATQEVTVPPEAADKGFRLTAVYELLSQAVIESTPLDVTVEVDGGACAAPCSIDRPNGTDVSVTAPEVHKINHAYWLEFMSWADGAERTRTISVQGEASKKYTASYKKRYLLDATSYPEDAVTFTLDPPSANGFYDEGTTVKVTAEANEGYKFRRWEGDFQGTFKTYTTKMTGPRTVVAMTDEVKVAAEAWVRNAVGETPEEIVAPGSIISIYGSTLALHFHVGPASPLAQTLLGTTVMADNRVLALMFVSPEQINAVLHPDIPDGTYTLVISRPGELDIETEIVVNRNAPGLFTRVFDGKFFTMASHEDGTPITPDSPARRGELISVYGTGFGPYDKLAPYGFALPVAPEYLLADKVELLAGDIPLEAEFAGGAAGYTGTDVLKIRISDALPAASTLELKASVNGHQSNTVLLPIE